MTNETLNTLCTRRSVKGFKDVQISDEQLIAILKAGEYAPTGMNNQSPIMIVVQDKTTIKTLSEINAKIMGNPTADPFYGAPTVVIVLADKSYPTYIYDGSLVMGNLLNAAHSVGVDSCWIHRAKETFQSDEGKALLEKWGITGDYEGIGNCVLGFARGVYPNVRPRKDNYVKRV